jgi:hypothetical protein
MYNSVTELKASVCCIGSSLYGKGVARSCCCVVQGPRTAGTVEQGGLLEGAANRKSGCRLYAPHSLRRLQNTSLDWAYVCMHSNTCHSASYYTSGPPGS